MSRLKTVNDTRWASGEEHPNSKLYVEEVKAIRRRYAAGGEGNTIRELAKEFVINKNTIRSIVYGLSWKHVPFDGLDPVIEDRRCGVHHHCVKLTELDIKAIRTRYRRSCRYNGGAALAKEYGCSFSTIIRIATHQTWKRLK